MLNTATVTENDGGQRLTCKLKGDVAVPEGEYKLRLVSRGVTPLGSARGARRSRGVLGGRSEERSGRLEAQSALLENFKTP